MRIDAHIHFSPPEMAADLAAFVEQEPYWGLLVAGNAANHTVQGWATAERMIADMDRAGVDRVMLMGEYRQRHEACVARNDQALALLCRWPDRISAFAVVQPKAGGKALDELTRCLDAGMAGVGELGPYGQGYTLDDPDFLRLAEACIRRDVPMNLHVSEEIGHFYLGKSATPLLHYYRLACRYPELKLILAHWGGGLLFYELMPEVRRNLRNVWYDTAGSPLLFPTEAIFRTALGCVDHRKLLYGSDYPLLICPRRQAEPDFQPFISEIDALGSAPDIYGDIMGGNAARLLGLARSETGQSKARAETGQSEARSETGQSEARSETGQSEARSETGQSKSVSAPKRSTRNQVVTEITPEAGVQISRLMAVSAVAQAWPATQPIFERHGIPWRDSPVPYWEPIAQAAAARGWGPADQGRLLDELNAVIGSAAPPVETGV